MYIYLCGGSSRDEEPLVDAGINWSRSLVLTLGNAQGAGFDAVRGVLEGGVGPKSNVRDANLRNDK